MGTRKKLRILASWSSAAQVQMLDGIEVGIFAPAVLDQHPVWANRARQAASLSGHQMCWFECANLNTRLLGYLFALQTKII